MTMARPRPEFYLVSGETVPTIGPRGCHIQRRLSPMPEDEYLPGYEFLLVKIEPRLHWETWRGTIDTDELVLAQRGRGPAGYRPIYPTTDWPGWVNVCQILNENIKRTGKASPEDLEHIFIAGLWPTREEAEKSLMEQLGPDSRRSWI
jgi:hypothetical protein